MKNESQAGAVAWQCRIELGGHWSGWAQVQSAEELQYLLSRYKELGQRAEVRELFSAPPAAVSVEALEGLVADMRGAADETSDHYEAKSLRLFARRLTQLIKERSNGAP